MRYCGYGLAPIVPSARRARAREYAAIAPSYAAVCANALAASSRARRARHLARRSRSRRAPGRSRPGRTTTVTRAWFFAARAHHRRAADVDVLDDLVVRRAAASRRSSRTGRGSRRRDRSACRRGARGPASSMPPRSEDAAVDARVERLHAAVHDLGRAGVAPRPSATGMPAAASAFAVPPVERSSTPRFGERRGEARRGRSCRRRRGARCGWAWRAGSDATAAWSMHARRAERAERSDSQHGPGGEARSRPTAGDGSKESRPRCRASCESFRVERVGGELVGVEVVLGVVLVLFLVLVRRPASRGRGGGACRPGPRRRSRGAPSCP